ncbi:hypothetical protein CDAR_621451 [Caerostris darwini]|uniref:Uncharacterized protein n=1 Tax=Caerostris darwini TaxID=1538125 RepID=A0AAV4S8I0_9ARAC|nr:hypothetical protein CDAR_621451 [Caerostris darwini]
MSDESDSDYENAIFYPVMLPYPVREALPPNRENELAVHQRPLVVCNQPSDESLALLQDHQWDVGAVSHDSLRLNRERASQSTADSTDAAARLGPERNLLNADWVHGHACIAEPRSNARGWRFRMRRFLGRMRSRARSALRL